MKSQKNSNRLQDALSRDHVRGLLQTPSRPRFSGAHLGAKEEGEGDGGGQLGVNKQHQVQQVGVGRERILQENPVHRHRVIST